MNYLPGKVQESGQALLIVLLSMAVVLTVVLSTLSLSVTDVAVTSREEESIRAFSAAEAGIEQALIASQSVGQTDIGNASFTANVSGLAAGQENFVYPQELLSGESANIWFVAHDADGNLVCDSENPCFTGDQLKLCWGAKGTPSGSTSTPAIEASFYYLTNPSDYSTTKVARVVLDPYVGRTPANFFSAPDSGTCSIGGTEFAFQKNIILSTLGITGNLQFVNARLLYSTSLAHGFGVDVNFAGNGLLPSQGVRIESIGTAGEATRRVEVHKLFSFVPTNFMNAIYNSGGIVQ